MGASLRYISPKHPVIPYNTFDLYIAYTRIAVDAYGVFVTERRGPDVLCRTAAEDVYGDVSIVQVHRETVNTNSLATFQTLRHVQ
jgi:hypothetical protein